jgi:tRNA-binding protein
VEAAQEVQRLDALVGRIVGAEQLVGGRGPSYRVTVDLGPRGRREATLALPSRSKDELVGRQVVCAMGEGEPVILGARSHARGLVLLRPDEEVEEGSPVA